MKVWELFGSIAFLIVIGIFGYTLSNDIVNNIEYIIFWMLYLSTMLTLSIIMASFIMSFSLKDLKGKSGERGEIGTEGMRGETGICESNCRDNIGFNIIIKAMEYRLTEKENVRTGGKEIDAIEMEINDYIIYLDNLNKTDKEIMTLLKEKYKGDTKINEKFKKIGYIQSVIQNVNNDVNIKITNMYVREKIKSMMDSKEFKEIAVFRGPMTLIEYIKDIWLIWTDLIYDESNINYFKSIGAENDFEWIKNNPFNEIKKYDIYCWGMPEDCKARENFVNTKYKKKIDKEGFQDYTKIETSKVDGIPINEKGKLKIIKTNDYYLSYDDVGTTMMEQLRAYRPYPKDYKGEKYHSIGDVVLAPVKDTPDVKKNYTYGNLNEDNLSNSKGNDAGPNRETILVSGDVKRPVSYDVVWNDLQKEFARHWTCKLCKKHPRYSHYKGVIHRPVCPEGYTSMGEIYTSSKNIPDELDKRIDKFEFTPTAGNEPVCIPNDCVENIKGKYDKNPKIIWDTHRSKRPKFGSNASNWYIYTIENAQIFSLSPRGNENNNEIPAKHKNAYNLSKVQLETKDMKNKHNNTKRVLRDAVGTTYDTSKLNNTIKEDFLIFALMVITAKAISDKYRPLKFRPNMYSIKESCIIRDDLDRDINLNGDDNQHPSLLKEDKTGDRTEDNTLLYISDDDIDKEIKKLNKKNYDNPEIKKVIALLNVLQNKNKNKNLNVLTDEELSNFYEINNVFQEFLNNDEIEFTAEDINIFEIITEYIGFLSSFPTIEKYKELHKQKERIHTLFKEVIAPINEERLNKLKDKLGLGWKGIPRFDNKGVDYSAHHFMYIPEKGTLLFSNKKKITFELHNYPNYILKYQEKYLQIDKNNEHRIIHKQNKDLNDNSFYFKLRFSGNKQNEILISPSYKNYKNKYLKYTRRNHNIHLLLVEKTIAVDEATLYIME
jgi:hypothetical protein